MLAIRLVSAAATLVLTAFAWLFVIAHIAFTELCSGSKFSAKGDAERAAPRRSITLKSRNSVRSSSSMDVPFSYRSAAQQTTLKIGETVTVQVLR
jgi:hypothetical protein